MESQPIIPVYLNQTNVFDLLAMLSDGIATVTSVSASKGEAQRLEKEASGMFGLGSAFDALLKIDLSGKRARTAENDSREERTEERIHTPASLLFKLKSLLEGSKMVADLRGSELPLPGHFVDFGCVLQRSPLTAAIDGMVEVLKVSTMFENQAQGKGKPKNNIPHMIKQFGSLSDSLKLGQTVDLIGVVESEEIRTVITLNKEFLSDPLMMNLIDGNFRVLGKVVRSVKENDDPIGLARNSALGSTPQILEQLVTVLRGLNEQGVFSFQDPETHVAGPALQVIPIAIYS